MCDESRAKGDEAARERRNCIEGRLHEERDTNKDAEGTAATESSVSNDAAARWPDLKTGATTARRLSTPHFQQTVV